ncbi:MAG: alpha/beta hydrolase, partial [Actinomycetota bacterium]|nr:alpha/beta hydrolase [Actinomycetota bacterium]
APDLTAVARVAGSLGLSVALLQQPYRVAGRRSPAPAAKLDEAWIAAVSTLRERHPGGPGLVLGGRSSGARVACRTASPLCADAVLCLAFPLQPARRRRDGTAPPSRLAELESVSVPTLVVQGVSDPFGVPPPAPQREVVTVRGDHGLKGDLDAVAQAASEWLSRVL